MPPHTIFRIENVFGVTNVIHKSQPSAILCKAKHSARGSALNDGIFAKGFFESVNQSVKVDSQMSEGKIPIVVMLRFMLRIRNAMSDKPENVIVQRLKEAPNSDRF